MQDRDDLTVFLSVRLHFHPSVSAHHRVIIKLLIDVYNNNNNTNIHDDMKRDGADWS